MAKILFANNATTTLATSMSNTVTNLDVVTGTGSLFPSIGSDSGDYFYITIVDKKGQFEIVKVINRVEDKFTVIRAQEGTKALAFDSGSQVEQRITAGALNDVISSLQSSVANIASTIYPVGSIYMSMQPTAPSLLFGGTWEALDDGRVLIGANTTYAAGTVGGSSTRVLNENHLPKHSHTATTAASGAHSHTRGTMNITGQFVSNDEVRYTNEAKGAFSAATATDLNIRDHELHTGNPIRFSFDASKSWTGNTSTSSTHTHKITVSTAGDSAAFNIMQPYLSVYMWKRIA